MIFILVVILLIVAIVAISRSGKKNKVETEKLQAEVQKNSIHESKVNVSDELLKLKKLLDDGIINQEEFDKQKKKLLD